MSHGNNTENTSFLDICEALKNNIFRTMSVADVCVVRELNSGIAKCAYITNSDTVIEAYTLFNADIQVNDVVLIVFTNNDFRTSLKAFKNNQANTNTITKKFHEKSYGVIVGLIYRKTEA